MSEPITDEQDANLEIPPAEPEPEITEEDANEPAEPGPDEFDTPVPAPEEHPDAQPSGMSEQEIEEMYRKLDLEAKRHTKRVGELLGDQATEAIVCPFCEPELQGFLRPESLDHPRDEIHGAMIDVLKKPAQVDFQEAPHAHTCEACAGLGQVLSGSRVAGKERIVCPRCSGNGYTQQGTGQSNGHATATVDHDVPLVSWEAAMEEERDEFGSPRFLADGRENPNFGRTLKWKDPSIENDYLLRMTGQLA